MALDQEPEIYDVIIVGGGPAGLAVAARLREAAPAAIFTDEEHRRYQWLRKHGQRVSVKQVKTGNERRARSSSRETCEDDDSTRMLVIDASGDQWMGRWDRLFGAYGITHLRSPLLWHVDPQDRDSLLARAHEQGRPDDLFDIGACVGREISKHKKKKRSARRGGLQDAQPNVDINERERNDYFTPSRRLFWEHCCGVRDRYGLAGLLKKETLCDVDYGVVRGLCRGEDARLFTVTTDKTRRYARVVILAVGPANVAALPRIPGLLRGPRPEKEEVGGWAQQLDSRPAADAARCPQASHTFHLRQIPDPVVAARVRSGRRTHVLVVGGGLTAAQVADVAVQRGVAQVWLVMRGRVVVKYFDVDLGWMGKYRNREQARFWSADSDAERLAIVAEARGGGSITPHYHRVLKKHVTADRVRLHPHTVVSGLSFVEGADGGGGHWHVTTEPAIAGLPPMDYVYFATGIDTDVGQLPYLQTMDRRFPIDTVGGYPCLTEDLMWADGVPLFCTGKLAMLRVGPAAPNIGGVKIAAERVALAAHQVLGRTRDTAGQAPSSDRLDYASGVGSKYKCLSA